MHIIRNKQKYSRCVRAPNEQDLENGGFLINNYKKKNLH